VELGPGARGRAQFLLRGLRLGPLVSDTKGSCRMRDHERALMADRRAIIEAARRKLDEVDALLAKRRLQQCTSPRRPQSTHLAGVA
jgi:hypothetical protein